MSDLKYKNVTELRTIIRSCVAKRNELEDDIAACRARIERLAQEVTGKGKAINNIAQREVWARKYLAEKTLKNVEHK